MTRRQETVCVLVALSLVVLGCGGAESPGTDIGSPAAAAEGGGSERELPAVLRLGEPRFGDFDMMVEKRIVRVATTFSKTNYFLAAGEPKGATYEALMAFEKFINGRLGTGRLKVHVFVVPVARDELFPALLEGRVDIAAANLTVTPERLELVDFSDAAIGGVSEVVVTGPESPELASLNDLAGEEVFVRRSSSYYESLQALSDDFRAEGHEPIRIREVDELLETEDIMELVGAGAFSMTVADSHLAEFWQDVLDGIAVRSDLAVATGRSIAWAFRKDSPKLAQEINAFVKGHKKGTLFGNVILKRYLGDNERVRNPLAESDLELLRRYRGYFEEYAAQYGLDWVLVAAAAYQESRFNQDLESSHGAVGIMQIKPATAADKNVGITDILTASNNIHAGVKYMRFLRDRYFKDEEVDALNQGFFTLAAYNAGPARVARFREQAREKGLDPNVWFRQVEQMASRQTVDYVSNIFKYYVSYREYLRRLEALDGIKGG